MNILLVTESYPLDGPDTPFVPRKVAFLSCATSLTLAPVRGSVGQMAELPEGTSLRRDLTQAPRNPRARLVWSLRALLSPALYAEIAHQAPESLAPRASATIAARLGRSLLAERWMRRYLKEAGAQPPDVVYAWWSFAETLGIARALADTSIPLVARAHGYDLFAEQEPIGFVPFQRELITQATCVVSASEAGAAYLRGRYPDLADKITTAYLGTLDPGAPNEPSKDGVLRIVTCSSNTAVKRVDLLARALSHLAKEAPDIDFQWTHIGDGPLAGELIELVASLPGMDGRCTFTGLLPPPEVGRWLKGHRVDLFVNVSSSEGLPVTLMEAASFGIPMMATAVGGNPEIVNDDNGLLLAPNPSPAEIASAIRSFAGLTEPERARMRAASRATFLRSFDEANNHRAFYELLSSIAARGR